MAREKVIPAVAEIVLSEEIHAYTHDHTKGRITVAVGLVDGDGVFIVGQDFDTIHLGAQDYIDMMAADGGPDAPSPGKPAGTFRKDDMWHFIDKIRARR